MKTMKTMIAAAALVSSVQAMAAECWIVGQDPKDVNSYNQLIQYAPNAEASQGKLLYQSADYAVAMNVGENGKFSASTIQLNPQALSAAAVGSQDEVQLIDGHLKISVFCRK
jgi:hypothetical protein